MHLQLTPAPTPLGGAGLRHLERDRVCTACRAAGPQRGQVLAVLGGGEGRETREEERRWGEVRGDGSRVHLRTAFGQPRPPRSSPKTPRGLDRRRRGLQSGWAQAGVPKGLRRPRTGLRPGATGRRGGAGPRPPSLHPVGLQLRRLVLHEGGGGGRGRQRLRQGGRVAVAHEAGGRGG